MIRYVLLVSLLLVNLNITQGESFEDVDREGYAKMLCFDVDNAIKELKSKPLYLSRDLKEIDSLAYGIIYTVAEDSLVSKFKLSKKDLVICIETLSITEGSIVAKKGLNVYKSTLFLNSNNPFGIKGVGHIAMTTEYIEGNRQRMSQSFKKFDSFEGAVNFLLYLLIVRYKSTEATTRSELFLSLKKGGYFTAGNSYLNMLNSISNDIAALR